MNRKLFLGLSLYCGESPLTIGMHAISNQLKDVLATLSEETAKL